MTENYDISIEKIVLGTFIIEPKAMAQHTSKLSLNLFYNKTHQIIFEIINQKWRNNEPIDLAILIKELSKSGKRNLDKYIIDLTMGISSSANLEYHIMVLVEHSIKRDFIEKFSHLLKIASNPSEDIFHIRDKAFEYFDKLFIDQFIDNNKQSQTFPQLIELVQEKAKNITNGEITGIPSSLNIINKVIGGWQKSDLTIIAGRPGMGKTAFIIQQIVDVVQQGLTAAIFSLEMSAEQIAGRIITNYTGIPNYSILRKGMTNEEWTTFFGYKDSLLSLNIHIDDTPSISIHDLRVKAKMLKLRYNINILFVDYLQLVTYEKANNREQEIGNISRGLKAIAKEFNIPVIALSQLSRKVEERPDKRPLLSDLRDSGSIEQDADEVIFLFRPEYYGIEEWGTDYNNEKTENEVEIIIQKNRQGGILSERCRIHLPTSKFIDL
ncbi:replicative DNA helicase [Chryseobacterium nematophagum]|uniref:DNA 5'-3' helicase n=1 Tax=Chryseobacterium nematophagum TaxID=2305228 RepID=A0A3M7TEF7_9FLAO|nr:replicative DNA helicase [Chryseobacterium nematophagum]RNA61454.1 replicative DNA helicase [Chryseobacterium nematophagum]